MALRQLSFLPAPPSWYPGHMTAFARTLPALLGRTDVVLELRDGACRSRASTATLRVRRVLSLSVFAAFAPVVAQRGGVRGAAGAVRIVVPALPDVTVMSGPVVRSM